MINFYRNLLRDLGEVTGLKDLAFNDAGVCEILVDDKMSCAFVYKEANESMSMVCEIFDSKLVSMSKEMSSKIMDLSLDAISGDFPVVGWDRRSGRVIAFKSISKKHSNVEMLVDGFSEFLMWCKKFSEEFESEGVDRSIDVNEFSVREILKVA